MKDIDREKLLIRQKRTREILEYVLPIVSALITALIVTHI